MAELLDVSTEPVKIAQTNAPGTEPTSWMPLSEEARNTAPETIKGLFEAKKWGSMEDLANGYVDLEKVLGKGDHIFKPESVDDADGWNKFWTAYGRPDSSDKYEYAKDENLPLDDDLMGRWKDASFKAGKTQEQFEGDVALYVDIMKEVQANDLRLKEDATATSEAEKEVVRKALVTRFGGEVAYQDKMKESRQIADDLGIFATLEKKGLTSDPEIIGMLHDIVEKTAEGVLTRDNPPTGSVKDPLVEMAEIKANPIWMNKFHPERKALQERYMELNMQIANSGNAPKREQGG